MIAFIIWEKISQAKIILFIYLSAVHLFQETISYLRAGIISDLISSASLSPKIMPFPCMS